MPSAVYNTSVYGHDHIDLPNNLTESRTFDWEARRFLESHYATHSHDYLDNEYYIIITLKPHSGVPMGPICCCLNSPSVDTTSYDVKLACPLRWSMRFLLATSV